MRNQPVVATKDKLEEQYFRAMINTVLGSLRDARKHPEGRKGENQQDRVLSPPQLGPTLSRRPGPDLFCILGLASNVI